MDSSFIVPPPPDTLFDRKSLEEVISCPAIKSLYIDQRRLFDREDCRNFPWLVKLEIGPERSEAESILILKQENTPESLSEQDKALLNELNAELINYDVEIKFEHRPTEWILKKLLPDVPNITCHFEIVGHIAHLNLRGEEMLKAKYIIGAVILEKNQDVGIRTVVNKVGAVDNEFRVLPMELLAGSPETMVTVLESGCTFKFDFSDVFWNSRLQGEHQRIIRMMNPGKDVVCDMFAGVGPFAIPMARKGVKVYANDLNPKSYEWMVKNADKNLTKNKLSNIVCSCLDGREFARKLLSEEKVAVTHVLMNLPKLAPEFCDVFVGLLPRGAPLPKIHVYCFGTGETPEIMQQRALSRIETALGGVTLDSSHCLEVLKIRQTSTNTLEFCISFILPSEIAYMPEIM